MLFRNASSSATAFFLVILTLAGCRQVDPRTTALSVGMVKDSVLQVMGAPGGSPASYLMGGQYIEVLRFRSDGGVGPIEGLDRESITPLVIVDGALTGWGWDHLDSVAGEHGIPVDPAE